MAPKRKATSSDSGNPKKAKKTSQNNRQVHWALPKEGSRGLKRDEKEARKYAQLLYGHPWDGLSTSEEPLPNAQLKAPIGKRDDLTDEAQNHISKTLRTFWSEVRNQCDKSDLKNASGARGSMAVVASRTPGGFLLALTQDYRLEVTVNDQRAHVDFIRRSRPDGSSNSEDSNDEEVDDAGVDYFIRLPEGTSVTVNGRTYSNDASASEDGPFFLGPLRAKPKSFFIIELLSQPVFFFRTPADSEYTTKSKPKVKQEELDKRDSRGGDDSTDVQVTWTRIEDSPEPQLSEQAPSARASTTASVSGDEAIDRTWLTPAGHPQKDSSVLFVYQSRVDERLTLHVLDPMAWRTTAADRVYLFQSALELLRDSLWWEEHHSGKAEAEYFPREAYWMECPQHREADEARAYTLLNAWALALGLDLDSKFIQNELQAERNRFTNLADGLIDLAYRSREHDSLLVTFCQMEGYARPSAYRTLARNIMTFRYSNVDSSTEAEMLPSDERKDGIELEFTLELDRDSAAQVSSVQKSNAISSSTSRSSSLSSIDSDVLAEMESEMEHELDPESLSILQSAQLKANGLSSEKLASTMDESHGLTIPPTMGESQLPGASSTLLPNFVSLQAEVGTNDGLSLDESLPRNSFHEQPNEVSKGQEELHFDAGSPDLDDFDSCNYFSDGRDAIIQEPLVASAIADLRTRVVNPTTITFGQWLTDEEVSLAIASVTLGITQDQDHNGGFACLSQTNIQACMNPGLRSVERTIRPGRPMIVALNHNSHINLLVIQFGENEQPTFSILDSRPHHHDRESRKTIYEAALNLMRSSEWGRHPTIKDERIYTEDPDCVTWIPVASQPSSAECGYHAILNAWTIALGLLPDPKNFPTWTNQYFQDLIDIIHLARVGVADWRLIFAFLKCKGFVLEGEVPEERQFRSTVNLPDEGALNVELRGIEGMESFTWHDQDVDVQLLKLVNRVELPEGRQHHEDWICDSWNAGTLNMLPVLERSGILNIDADNDGVRQLLRQHKLAKGRVIMDELLQKFPDLEKQVPNSSVIIRQLKHLMKQWRSPDLSLVLNTDPSGWHEDSTYLHEYLLNSSVLRSAFKTGIRKHHTDVPFDNWEVNMAITAVVEAIDSHQRASFVAQRTDPTQPFAGGFTLAASSDLQAALLGSDNPMNPKPTASRPRRCWLMPLCVGNKHDLLGRVNAWRDERGIAYNKREDGNGHTLLAVVQEQLLKDDADETRLVIYLLDSRPDIFENAKAYLFECIANATKRLGWATHRDPAQELRFSRRGRNRVPQQERGGWQCGLHTIVNAWILAMGLQINPDAIYSATIYSEAWQLARAAMAGILDWRTLVAWLFSHNLTVERDVNDVPENRHFELSVLQEPSMTDGRADGDRDLEQRTQAIYAMDDGPLAALPIGTAPYDHSNNIRRPAVVPPPTAQSN